MMHDAIPLYRKVTAVMISFYLIATFAVRFGGVSDIQPQVAIMAGIVLVVFGAVLLNFILKSVAATISMIVLLAVVSVVSALVLVVLFAVIGSLMNPPPIRDYAVRDQGGRAWRFPSHYVVTDPRTKLPVGYLGNEPFDSL